MQLISKLPTVGDSIFSVIAGLSREHNAVNLGQGFPDFETSSVLKKLVAEQMLAGNNQYAPMPGVPSLVTQLCQKLAYSNGVQIDGARELTITTGATQAIYTAIATVVKKGDEVVIIEPAYDAYRPVIELHGGKVVAYQLEAPNYRVNWQDFGALLNEKTKLVIINTPHNPTGTILRKEDMLELERLLGETNAYLLSDEVYEHLIYDGETHESALRFPRLRERSFVCYSFGKTFHNTGWKMGFCVAPPALTKEFRKLHQFTVFSVNTPIQYALAEYMQDASVYTSLPAFFEEKRNYFQTLISDSRLRLLACEGTYFQLVDYSEISDKNDVEFAQELIVKHGLATIPLSPFYSGKGGDAKVLRLCFAKRNDTLEAAARIINTL